MTAKLWIVIAVVSASLTIVPTWATARDSATAQEVIQKTREAAEYLAKTKASGIETFKTMKSQFVWKDSYVWVLDCDHDMFVANPNFTRSTGTKLSSADSADRPIFQRFCEQGRRPKGGWVEYTTTKPGGTMPFRKLAYIRPVPGTSYEVAAGFFDATAKLDDLQKLSDSQ